MLCIPRNVSSYLFQVSADLIRIWTQKAKFQLTPNASKIEVAVIG